MISSDRYRLVLRENAETIALAEKLIATQLSPLQQYRAAMIIS
jgi:hypothetical protein